MDWYLTSGCFDLSKVRLTYAYGVLSLTRMWPRPRRDRLHRTRTARGAGVDQRTLGPVRESAEGVGPRPPPNVGGVPLDLR